MSEAMVDGGRVTARRGFYPLVVGDDVEVGQGGGVAFIAKHDLTVNQGGGQWLVALGEIEVKQGGALLAIGKEVEIENGFCGVALGKVELEDGGRVLMTTRQAIALGIAVGFGIRLARRLLDRP